MPTAQRGSVLVAVLAIIALLSFMVVRFMDQAMEDLQYRALYNQPAEVRAFGYSMLEVTLATIREVALVDEGKLYAPEQGWSDPIEYAEIPIPNGWTVTVSIQDEGSKLSLNTINEELLNEILEEEFDIDFGTTRELSSTLFDWIDEDDSARLNGAESAHYLNETPPYKAANRPLQSLEELSLLKVWQDEFFDQDGLPNERFEQLSMLFSVINSGPVNINSATQPVLDAIAMQDGWNADNIFDGLDDPYLKNIPDSVNSTTAGTEIGLLTITIRVKRGNVPFTISALVEPVFGNQSENSSTVTQPSSGALPGRRSNKDELKTGAASEQDAIGFPYKILRLTEYEQGEAGPEAARYSTVDIKGESTSF